MSEKKYDYAWKKKISERCSLGQKDVRKMSTDKKKYPQKCPFKNRTDKKCLKNVDVNFDENTPIVFFKSS